LDQRKKELDSGPEPPRQLVSDFTTICNDTPDSDGKVKLEGRRIPFHTALLAEHSRSLARIFSENEARDGDFTEVLGFGPSSEMRADSFQALLRFVYYGDTTMSTVQACDMMEFSRLHDLKALHQLATTKVIEAVTVDTVFSILPVTYLQHLAPREDMKQLRTRCIRFVIDHLNALDLTELRAYSPIIAIDILHAVQTYEKATSA
jgi:BTB/POZ domain